MKKNIKIMLIVPDKGSHVNSFPLGIAYLAAIAKENGYNDIKIVNQEVYHYSDEYIKELLDKEVYDVVGIGAYGYQQYRKALSICKKINESKNRDKFKILLGAHGPTAEPEFFLNKFKADIIVRGEGEIIFKNVLESISSNTPLSQVKGISYMENNEVKFNESEPLVKELDSLLMPAWELFPMEHYVLEKHISAKHIDRCFHVISSRGCPYNCNFCYRMYKGYRLRSVNNVIKELTILKEKYKITHFTFLDENLMSYEKRAIEFSEAMINANLGVTWDCMGRLNVAKPKILELMKKAGCTYINYGIESLDQEILDSMNKAQKVEEAYIGVENTIKAGLHPGLNLIWGYVGDTKEALKKSVEFLKKYNTGIQLRTIKPVTPYPGTELFKIAVKQGLLKNAEDFYNKYLNSDRMTVNFTDIPEEEFYKLLFEANKEVVIDFYTKNMDRVVEGFRKCYFEYDVNYRGPRHR